MNKNAWMVIVIMVLAAVGSYFAYKYYQVTNLPVEETTTETETVSPTITEAVTPMESWETYSNSTHHISFSYPNSWTLTEKPGSVEKGVTYNSSLELKKDGATIKMIFNVNGIGGLDQTYEGVKTNIDGHSYYKYFTANTYNKTKIVGISDALTTLGFFTKDKITYYIALQYPDNWTEVKSSPFIEDFDSILETFKFEE